MLIQSFNWRETLSFSRFWLPAARPSSSWKNWSLVGVATFVGVACTGEFLAASRGIVGALTVHLSWYGAWALKMFIGVRIIFTCYIRHV
ncbi:hypothetical protein JOM56_011463 [Amanita muscaria]